MCFRYSTFPLVCTILRLLLLEHACSYSNTIYIIHITFRVCSTHSFRGFILYTTCPPLSIYCSQPFHYTTYRYCHKGVHIVVMVIFINYLITSFSMFYWSIECLISIYYFHPFQYTTSTHFNVLLTPISIYLLHILQHTSHIYFTVLLTLLSIYYLHPFESITYTHFSGILPPISMYFLHPFQSTTYTHFNLLLAPISIYYLHPFQNTVCIYIHFNVLPTPTLIYN